MAFENLIGNEKTKNLLSNMIEQDKITHSYLFIGPRRGSGKHYLQRNLQK